MTLAKYHIAIDSKHKVMFRKNFFYDNKLEETAQPFVPGRNKIG